MRGFLFFTASRFTAFTMALAAVGVRADTRNIKVMAYNLQNLFDTVDNPSTSDEEFTPNGKQRWTEAVLEDKMRNLGEVIRAENPDVIGVEEVENQEILERFVKVGLNGQGYREVIAASSQDGRGIRTGIISRLPVVARKFHHISRSSWVEHGQIKTGRDVLEATLDTGITGPGRYVTVLVSHFLSKAGGPVRDGWRQQEAESVAEIMADLTKQNPGRLVISVGDFNDDLKSAPIMKGFKPLLDLKEYLSSASNRIFAADAEILDLPAEKRGTHYYHPKREWNTLDHVFIAQSADLKEGRVKGFHFEPKSVAVVHPREFMSNDGSPRGCEIIGGAKPNPKNNGNRNSNGRSGDKDKDPGYRTRCLDGASDHLAMTANFELR